jgi:hypothetical protein
MDIKVQRKNGILYPIMKRLIFSAAVLAATAPVLAADVGVSVSVGEPGFYGRIDIGNLPPPPVIYREPVVIRRAPADMVLQPVYLYVPPGHAKKWHKHCRKYNACNRPVYFVRENWYHDVYVPHYRERHHVDKGHGKGHRRD